MQVKAAFPIISQNWDLLFLVFCGKSQRRMATSGASKSKVVQFSAKSHNFMGAALKQADKAGISAFSHIHV